LKPARHSPGFLRAFSRIDESACNSKPKNLRQGERNPFNAVHDDLANYSRWVVDYGWEKSFSSIRCAVTSTELLQKRLQVAVSRIDGLRRDNFSSDKTYERFEN